MCAVVVSMHGGWCRASTGAGKPVSLEDLNEEEVITLLSKIVNKVTDRDSAVDMCEDGTTVRMLLQLLRSPNSSKACAAWAPSKLLRLAASAAGGFTLCPDVSLHRHECHASDADNAVAIIAIHYVATVIRVFGSIHSAELGL